jgi:hypothetical protein
LTLNIVKLLVHGADTGRGRRERREMERREKEMPTRGAY